ncbi:hypothetical protein [Paenibacillus popilliae]|uniref:hypothetical protein n=1 Tax=Paenibacillus popilliae TaxID=78057 RepID=UPI00163C0B5B|nr:hypothetical protein [Paenibacillus sp. SDF0028]
MHSYNAISLERKSFRTDDQIWVRFEIEAVFGLRYLQSLYLYGERFSGDGNNGN